MAQPIPRQTIGPISNGGYYSVEEFLNEITVFILNNITVKALAVGITDTNGNQVNPGAIATPTTITSGTKTVTTAGTAVQITAVSTPIKGVWINADLLQGSVVAVGDSGVKANASGMKGLILTPGNPPIFLAISDLNLLWVDAQTNGGKLSFAYVS